MATPVLDVYSFCYQDTGVILNPNSMTLPFVDITGVQGLDMPEFKLEEHDRASAHGTYINAAYLKQRTIVLDGILYAATATSLQSTLETLKANYRPQTTSQPFYWRTVATSPNDYRKVFGYSQGLQYDISDTIGLNQAEVTFTIECDDPREYLGTFVDVTGNKIVAANPTLTLTIPAKGTMNYPGIITITIPASSSITTPKINNTTVGKYIEFSGAWASGAGVTSTIVIDLLNRTCLWTNGTNAPVSMRNSWTTGAQWWEFAAGVSNTVQITASAISGSNEPVVVTPWPAWW